MFVFQTWLRTLDIQGVGTSDANGFLRTDDPVLAERMRKNPLLREVTGAIEAAKESVKPPSPKKRGRPKVVVGARTSEIMEREGEGE